MPPPYDTFTPQDADPAAAGRLRLLDRYNKKFGFESGAPTSERPQEIYPAPAGASLRPAVTPISPDPENSPPVVPDSTTRQQPVHSAPPAPQVNFATEQPRRQEWPYPGQNTTSAAKPGSEQDWQAAIKARHESKYGEMDLGDPGLTKLYDPGHPFLNETPGALPEQNEDWLPERTLRGIASRVGDYGSGFAQMQADIAGFYANQLGDNLAGKALQGVSDMWGGASEMLDEIQSESYKPKYDDVGKALSDATDGHFGTLFGFMAEQAPLAVADALTSLAGFPIYFASLTGDFAKERATNDGRTKDELTASDYAYGSAAATVSFVLDKILLGQGHKLVSNVLGKEVVDKLANETKSNIFKRIASSGFEGAVVEGLEESTQQALTTVDTERGATLEDIALAGAGGALAGAPAKMGIDYARHLASPVPEPAADGVGEDQKAAIEASTTQGKPVALLPPPPKMLPHPRQFDPNYAIPMPGSVGPAPTQEQPPAATPATPPAAAGPGNLSTFVTPTAEIPGQAIPDGADQQVDPTVDAGTEANVLEATGQQPGDPVFGKGGELLDIAAPSKSARPQPTQEQIEEAESEADTRAREAMTVRRKMNALETIASKLRTVVSKPAGPGKPDRKLISVADTASSRFLKGIREAVYKGAPKKGITDEQDIKSNRDALSNFYDTLARYALVQADIADRNSNPSGTSGMSMSEFRKVMKEAEQEGKRVEPLQDASVEMSRARTMLRDVTSGNYAMQAGKGNEFSLFELANAQFHNIPQMLFHRLGVNKDMLAKAAESQDDTAFLNALTTITRRAGEDIRDYEEKVGKNLPGLPEPGKNDRIKLTAKERDIEAAVESMDLPPSPLKPPGLQVGELATSRTMYRDYRKKVRDEETGKLINNPNYGKRFPIDVDKPGGAEARAEIYTLEAEEEAMKARRATASIEPGISTGAGLELDVSKRPVKRVIEGSRKEVLTAEHRLGERVKEHTAATAAVRHAEIGFTTRGGNLTPGVAHLPTRMAKTQLREAHTDAKAAVNAAEKRAADIRSVWETIRSEHDKGAKRTKALVQARARWKALGGKSLVMGFKGDPRLLRDADAAVIAARTAGQKEIARAEKRVAVGEAWDKVLTARKAETAARLRVEDMTSQIKSLRGGKVTVGKKYVASAGAKEVVGAARAVENAEIQEKAERRLRGFNTYADMAEAEDVGAKIEEDAERARQKVLREQAKDKEKETAAEEAAKEKEAKESRKRTKAHTALTKFLNAAKKDGRQPIVDRINAMAGVIWNNRRTYRPKGGVWIINPMFEALKNATPEAKAEEEALPKHMRQKQYIKIPNSYPKPGKEGTAEDYNGDKIQVFDYKDVVLGEGKRYGETVYVGKMPSDQFREFPLNRNMFDPAKVNDLVLELQRQQVGTDMLMNREIAWILIDRVQDIGKDRSGTHGQPDKTPHKARTESLSPGVKPEPKDDEGTTEEPVEEPTEEPASSEDEEEEEPMTDADLAELAEWIRSRGTEVTEEEEDKAKRHILSLIEKYEIEAANVEAAEGLLGKMADDVVQLTPAEDGTMEYDAPPGWPTSWVDYWLVERDGNQLINAVRYGLEPYNDTSVATYHKVIIDGIGLVLKDSKIILGQLQRRVDDARKNWSEGTGNTIDVPTKPGGGKRYFKPLNWTEPEDDEGPEGDADQPGTQGYAHIGVSERVSPAGRRPVDMHASVEREPADKEPLLDQFGPLVDPGTMKPTGKQVSTSQRDTATRILHAFNRRMKMIGRKGWEKSMNLSGYLVANGTGAGKSIIVAMTASAMYDRQVGKVKLPVLIVHQNGLIDQVHDDFTAVGVDWKDNKKFKFIEYSQLEMPQVQAGKYAAVLFDEAHWIKTNLEETAEGKEKKYGPYAKSLKAPFRVFLTATPTDMALQEQYYLRYMQDSDDPLTEDEADDIVRTELRTIGEKNSRALMKKLSANGGYLLKEYISNLNNMIRRAAANNLMSSWTLVPTLKGIRVDIDDRLIDPEAAAAANSEANKGDTAQAVLAEHMKVPAMIQHTLDQLAKKDGDREWGVINVFRFANKSDIYGDHKLKKAAIDRMAVELMDAARERGIEVRLVVLKGGVKESMKSISDKFRDGRYNVILMTDEKGGTGLNLDDNSETGNRPKLTLVAGVSGVGQTWLQLMGRTDRQSTTSEPLARYLALPHNEADLALRRMIKEKIGIQRAATGATLAHESEENEFTYAAALDQQLRKRNPGAPKPYQSPVDAVITNKLTRGSVPALELVSDIANNETDPELAEVAKVIFNHPALAGVNVTAADLPTGTLGSAGQQSIVVGRGTGSEAVTTLHEAIHHITHWVIDHNLVARERLLQIMRRVPSQASQVFDAGVLTNPHEFVAAAYSDPQFRAMLKATKMPSEGNLWQRFVEFVRTILGAKGNTLTAFNAVMEMNLTDPGTVTDTGHGDVSTQLMTSMYRKRAAPAKIAALASRAGEMIEVAGDVKESLFSKLLGTLMLNQIVRSYGKDATDSKGVNHLQVRYDIREQQEAVTNREREKISAEAIDPFRNWAVKHGHEKVKATLTPGGQEEEITRLQLFTEIANASGYAKAHFGKDLSDDANSYLHPPKKSPKKGTHPRGRDRSHIYWELFKPQFENLDPEGMILYNHLADFFKEEVDVISVLTAANILDVVDPRKDGKRWVSNPKEVRDRIKKLNESSPEELEKLNIKGKDPLKHLNLIIKPGRSPGAYFPHKRWGDYVVVVDEKIKYTSEEERLALLEQYLGATDNRADSEIRYKSVSRFESQRVARQFTRDMRRKFPGIEVKGPLLSSSTSVVEHANLSEGLLKAFTDRIDKQDIPEGDKKSQINLMTQAMIDLMPESAFAETFLKRKGILGASNDFYRGLNAYGSSLAHYKGTALFAAKQREATRAFLGYIHTLEHGNDADIKKSRKLRTIANELGTRAAMTATAFSEQRWAHSANNIAFAFYLVSASYNIVNSTQPLLMTTPHLAGKFGMPAASSAMGKAYRMVGGTFVRRMIKTKATLQPLTKLFSKTDFDRKNYDILSEMRENMVKAGNVRQARMLDDLADRGIIDASLSMDMTQGSRQSQIDPRTGKPIAQGMMAYLSEWMRMAPHITEVLNRSVTAIAAFDLEFARLKKDGKTDEVATKAATDFAVTVINETQINYQNWNKPRYMQTPLARTALMFKLHPQNIYYYMVSRAIKSVDVLGKKIRREPMTAAENLEAKQAAKQLAYFIGMHVLATGALGGVPEPIKWLIGWLGDLFSEGDAPFNYELWVQNNMADWLGPELGQVGSRGLPAFAGLDLGSRIGISNLLMFDPPDLSSQDSFEAGLFRLLGGPMEGIIVNRPIRSIRQIQQGNYQQAVEEVMPKFLRDPLRAYRTATEGYTTYAGRVYSETNQMGPLEVFYTSLGLSPSSVSMMYSSRENDSRVDVMTSKRTKLMEKAYFARTDRAAWRGSLGEIKRWNRDNPVFAISVGDLTKSMKGRARNQAKTRGGMLVPEKYRVWAEEQNRFRGIAPQ